MLLLLFFPLLLRAQDQGEAPPSDENLSNVLIQELQGGENSTAANILSLAVSGRAGARQSAVIRTCPL